MDLIAQAGMITREPKRARRGSLAGGGRSAVDWIGSPDLAALEIN
jgi:hypothetical protein